MHIRMALLLGMVCYFSPALAGPLFTGPLLARSGHTIPAGHHDFEPYFFYTDNLGMYGRHWNLVHSPSHINLTANPLYSFGLTDWMDVQFLLPYTVNNANGPHSYHHFSDTTVLMGFQLIEQHGFWPDFRLSIAETLPTGKYENINNSGSSATGLGSYQTTLGFNFQYLYHLGGERYLRTRFVADYNYSSNLRVSGRSAYGGLPTSHGTVHPGPMVNVDLAFEYTWTRHWAVVMEGYFNHRQPSHFTGIVGNTTNKPVVIGHDTSDELSIAPAFEYNWNEHIGIIAGEWLSVTGKNAIDFMSTVVAINIFW